MTEYEKVDVVLASNADVETRRERRCNCWVEDVAVWTYSYLSEDLV